MRVFSWRWWFENRETGEITIAQSPNWPLYAILLGWIVRLLVDADSSLHDALGLAGTLLWLYWAGDEVVRGVNPWRRLLGLTVILLQLASLTR